MAPAWLEAVGLARRELLIGGTVLLAALLVIVYLLRRRRARPGDADLEGEWKHETADAERAHRRAQRRAPPVEMGEYVSFPVEDVDRTKGEAYGQVQTFRLFVDRDLPSEVSAGDVVCVQIVDWATNEDGQTVGAHARFEQRGAC